METPITIPASEPPRPLRGLLGLIGLELILLLVSFRVADLPVYLSAGTAVALFCAVLVFWKPEYLILAYIAALPLIQELSFHGIYFGDFLVAPHMIVQIILTIGVFSVFLFRRDREGSVPLNRLDKAFLVFFFATIFSLVYPYSLPVNHAKRWLLFYTGIFETVSFYFIIRYVLTRNAGFLDKILTALVLTSFSSLIVGVLEIAPIGFNLVGIFSSRMRIGFGYHNPNLFGIHSVVLFPILYYLVREDRFSSLRLMTWISLVVLILLSLLCFNRGSVIVLGFELLLIFILDRNKKLIYIFVATAAIIALSANDLIILYLYRFLGGGGTSAASALLDPSALYRLEAWKVGLQLLLIYPFGVGAGGYQFAWRLYGSDPSFYLGTPHQLFLSVGDDYGVLTLIVFLVILFLAYRYTSRLSGVGNGGFPHGLFRYLKVSILGFVAYGMITDGELSHLTGFIAPNNGYTLIFFTLLAVISVHYSQNRLAGMNRADR